MESWSPSVRSRSSRAAEPHHECSECRMQQEQWRFEEETNQEETHMRHLKSLLTSVLVGATALLASQASAQISERTLRWAQQNSLEHPQGQGAQKFSQLVEQKSGGKIKVRIFPSGQLGGDLQNVSALQGGTLDLMVLNAGLLSAQVKDFAVFDLPFLFNTPEEADAVAD